MNDIKIPSEARMLTLVSPAFPMRPPEVRHVGIVPQGILQAMNATWRISRFPELPVNMYLLNDVYVVEEGLVFNAQGQLYQESITQHSPTEIDRGSIAVREAINSNMPSQPGTVSLCKKRGVQNYGHWLMEMLPKAYLGRLYSAIPDLRYLVPAAVGQLRQVITDSLSMLQIGERDLIRLDHSVLHFERLLVVDGLTAHGVFMSPLVMNCIDALSARVIGGKPSKIMVTRDGMPSRRLINQDDLYRRAETSGYRLVEPTKLSFSEQIAAFKNATEIIGVMGAALTNIAFAPRDASVLTLAPASMPDTFFWFIAGLKGQTYREYRCQQTGPIKGVAPWDTDLAIRDGDLDEVLS